MEERGREEERGFVFREARADAAVSVFFERPFFLNLLSSDTSNNNGSRSPGIPTVAVFSDADSRAPHVSLADEAVRLGPPPPSLSYLDVPRLLEAAKATGATAVHPGYGFLSESSAFAERVVGSGLTWVGPPPSAMVSKERGGEREREF